MAIFSENHFSIKHDIAYFVLCYIPRAMAILGKKMEILEFTSKEAAAPLVSVAVPLWFWKFREKKLKFWIFFCKF